MNKKVLCIFAIICAAVFGFFTVSCTDKDYYDPEKEPNYVADRPSTLNYSTEQTVKLELNYDTYKGLTTVFDLYTDYPFDKNGQLRTDLSPIAGGINIAGESQLRRVLPAYVTKLYAYSSNLFVPLLSYAEIQNGIASFSTMDVEITEEIGTRAGNAGTFGKTPISKYLKQQDDFYMTTENGNYMYDLIVPDTYREFPTEVAQVISNTFRESKIADEKYYKDATIKITQAKPGQQGAEVFVSVIFGAGGFDSSLSYFVYEGNEDLTQLPQETIEKLEVINIFQYADVYTNTKKNKTKGLTPGKYVQLLYKNKEGDYVKEFPVGAQIGWILHPNAFTNTEGNPFAVKDLSYAARVFSVSYWNEANNKTKDEGIYTNNYNIFFSAKDNTGYTYNCFGVEDQPNKTGCDGDCNDVIFHILTNPANAIVSPPNIADEDIENTETKKGILAFEDNWPEKGDYDLNDVVIKYSSDITYVYTETKENGSVIETSDVTVKKVEDRFSFIHNGANFTNLFSYRVDISPSSIAKITITDESNGNTVDYTNSIVEDGSGFIIDLANNTLPKMTSGDKPYTVVMEFKDGTVSQDDFATKAAPYNPFITPRGNFDGAEVHLSMYLPTGRANMEWFGEKDDRSNGSTLWYVSGDNIKYPFALHLTGATEFRIPEEKECISTTYPTYLDWVDSGMTDSKDWYK